MKLRQQPRVEKLEPRTLLSAAWGTVDNFQLAAGKIASSQAMAADTVGNVYAVGTARDSTGLEHALVREKFNGNGSPNWTTIEDFTYSGAGAEFNGVALDAAGDLYVGGSTSNDQHCLVLERAFGQPTFSIVDDFAPGGYGAAVNGITVDGAGNVFAVGDNFAQGTWMVRERAAGQSGFSTVDNFSGGDAFGATAINSGANAGVYVVGGASASWVVRKSTDGGKTWNIVDDYQHDPGVTASAHSPTVGPNGTLYVAGQAFEVTTTSKHKTTDVQHWIVRKSTDGGASWSVSDDFQLSAYPSGTMANAAGIDLAGNVYVVGQATDSNGTVHSIVRTNTGGSWATVDNCQLVAGENAFGYGFAADSNGNLYVGGTAADSSSVVPDHWFVRSAVGPTARAATASAAVISSNQITLASDPTDFFHHRRRRRL